MVRVDRPIASSGRRDGAAAFRDGECRIPPDRGASAPAHRAAEDDDLTTGREDLLADEHQVHRVVLRDVRDVEVRDRLVSPLELPLDPFRRDGVDMVAAKRIA